MGDFYTRMLNVSIINIFYVLCVLSHRIIFNLCDFSYVYGFRKRLCNELVDDDDDDIYSQDLDFLSEMISTNNNRLGFVQSDLATLVYHSHRIL